MAPETRPRRQGKAKENSQNSLGRGVTNQGLMFWGQRKPMWQDIIHTHTPLITSLGLIRRRMLFKQETNLTWFCSLCLSRVGPRGCCQPFRLGVGQGRGGGAKRGAPAPGGGRCQDPPLKKHLFQASHVCGPTPVQENQFFSEHLPSYVCISVWVTAGERPLHPSASSNPRPRFQSWPHACAHTSLSCFLLRNLSST